ncbi:Aste57867_1653 [Aphanomyces stellatus]|uniref:Aste57867_1653 protein n=1 Tax=Aphanomyces stellatus TaxID=120398 RepID=A0A485K5M3_9STRA|nr:hypothetical protein As57867_001651 [Aphanomyces stellatus]VFT78866.1 Aste57867_1653 [Aphanomyces stellatus]
MSSEVESYVRPEFILPFPDFNPDAPVFPDHVIATIRTAMQSKGSPPRPPLTITDGIDAPYRRVFICYSTMNSMIDRLVQSLKARGYVPLLPSRSLADVDLSPTCPDGDIMLTSSTVLFVLGAGWHHKTNLAGLQRALALATKSHKRVVPILVGEQSLDFSRLYSLSRTPWYPFLDKGVSFDTSFQFLVDDLSVDLPLLALLTKTSSSDVMESSMISFFDEDELSAVSSHAYVY